jgi:hypothetical protein
VRTQWINFYLSYIGFGNLVWPLAESLRIMWPSCGLTPPPSAEVEWVELYLYSPSRPLVACYRINFAFIPVGWSWPASRSGMRTEFHSAVSIKNTVFRNVTPCRLVYKYATLFWKTTVNIFIKPGYGSDKLLWNVCLYIKFYYFKSAKTFLLLSGDMQNEFRDIQRFREVHNVHLLNSLSHLLRIERVRYSAGARFCSFTSGSRNRMAL